MVVHAWLEARSPRTWLPFLAVPMVVLVGYQWWTSHLYGHGPPLNAVAYATQLQVGGEWPSKVIATCEFTGGGAASFCLPRRGDAARASPWAPVLSCWSARWLC